MNKKAVRTAAAVRDIFIVFPPLSPALRADGRTKKDGAIP